MKDKNLEFNETADGQFANMGRPWSNRGTGTWLSLTAFLKDQLKKKMLQYVMHSVTEVYSKSMQLRMVAKRYAKGVEAAMNGLKT